MQSDSIFSAGLHLGDYAQLRAAALTSVNNALTRYDGHRYGWMDGEEKEDIVSDAVTKACQTFREDGGCSFRTWVRKIAFQITADRLESHHANAGITYESEDGDLIEIPELTDWASAEDVVIGLETRTRIDDLLAVREDPDSMIFDLYEQGYKSGEIATRLGLTEQKVYSRLHRIKKAVSIALAA